MAGKAVVRLARRVAKRAAERALVLGGAAYLARAARRPGAVVLAYHNVVPDDTPAIGDTSLHLTRRAFADQLDHLRDAFDVVPLGDLIGDQRADGGRCRVAITFDDAYHGALTLGIDELRRRDLPATVFVAPGLLGERACWWDLLAEPGHGEVPPALRERALRELGGRTERVLAHGAVTDPAALTPFHRPATVEVLQDALQRHPRLTLGAHSWNHPNLCTLNDAEIVAELLRPLEWLSRTTERWLPAIAYPYGLTSPHVARAAEACGYVAGWRADGGWMTMAASGDPLDSPRVTVPGGISRDGFALLVAGVR